jgi:hypothetical protein
VDGAKVETGRRKLGAIIGDRARTSCKVVLNPGTLLAQDTGLGPPRAAPVGVGGETSQSGGRAADFIHAHPGPQAAVGG